MTLNPLHSDKLLLSPVAIAGILTVLHAGLDIKNSLLLLLIIVDYFINSITVLLSQSHYLLYALSISAFPRILQTVACDDETIKHADAAALKEKQEKERASLKKKTALSEKKPDSMEVEETTQNIEGILMRPVKVNVRVGQAVDIAGQAGRPKAITGLFFSFS